MTMTRKAPKASEAQAKLLARLFAGQVVNFSSGYNTPTLAAIFRNGWVGLGAETPAPNKAFTWRKMHLTPAGEEALLSHLLDRRYRRVQEAGATP